MRPRQFIAFDVAGAGAWAIGCTILGFVLAESLDAALAALQHAKFGVAAVLLGVALFVAGRRGWRRRRDRSIGTVGGSSHSGGE
jgi:membrane protein DedA with SNARE-associated domain